MATTRQKEAAKENIAKARQVQSARAHGAKIPKQSQGLSTSQKDKLPAKEFAFPKQHKEPLTDARHVRNAIARFDQVEDVSDAERDKAWKRIMTAAKRFKVDVSESSWRELFKSSNKAAKSSSAATGRSKSSGTTSKSAGTRSKTAAASSKASGASSKATAASSKASGTAKSKAGTSRSSSARTKITGARSKTTSASSRASGTTSSRSSGTRSKTAVTRSRTTKAVKS